ncbi:MAG TPA: cyclic nucleotide-binding domain-containing protein [Actinomycetota bacterium]|jgi:CRP/FNR family cyclic AMP-dependent transcriptional regulator|nr:cyclic nucleotide-binding domain-containing protein [Actinomycetota bacterium]
MIANAITLWLVPAVLAVLVIAAAWVGVRWYYSEYLGSLGGAPLLQRLNTRQLRSIARSAARQEFGPAGRIVSEGERGDGFYVLETGSATVTVRGDPVATLGPGSYFGEMAVIDEGPRTATIVADTPTTVLHLPSSALRTLVQRDPTIGDAVAAELEQRLRNAGGEIPAASGETSAIQRLEMLSGELRRVRHEDWGSQAVARRRWWPVGR